MQDDIKKRLKQREDMFLRRLFGMLAKMAKADGKVDAPPARLRGVSRRLRSRWRGSTMPGTRSARREGYDDILPSGG